MNLTFTRLSGNLVNHTIRGLVTVNLVKDDFQSRCLVETVLNDQNVIALIDSGADSCYISEEMCKKANVFVEPYSCDVLVGNKEKLDVVGKASVSILLAQYEYKINCIVARHLTRDLILGWNGFIKVYNGTINAEEETFELDPPKRLSNIVYIEDNVTLNPYTETVLNVKTKETINTDLVTINRYDPLLNRQGVTVMPGIHYASKKSDDKRELKLVMANITNKTVKLLPYTIVALIENCNKNDLIETNGNHEEQTISEQRPHTECKINDKLSEQQKENIQKLLEEYKNLFTTSTKPTQTAKVQHTIEVENHKPINCQPARVGFKERGYIESQIVDMKANQIIQDLKSPWASRIVLVRKKDG